QRAVRQGAVRARRVQRAVIRFLVSGSLGGRWASPAGGFWLVVKYRSATNQEPGTRNQELFLMRRRIAMPILAAALLALAPAAPPQQKGISIQTIKVYLEKM